MPRFRRHRSSSAGSYQEGVNGPHVNNNTSTGTSTTGGSASAAATSAEDWGTAKELLHSLLHMKDAQGKGFLHCVAAFKENTNPNLHMAKCLLDRCRAVDDREEAMVKSKSTSSSGTSNNSNHTTWQDCFLVQPTLESGYTPLHAAIVAGDFAALLMYLQYPSSDTGRHSSSIAKPMIVLQAGLTEAARAVDAEGLTPLELLGKLQIDRLRRCRLQLQQLTAKLQLQARGSGGQLRSSSFDFTQQHEEEELEVLRDHMHLLGGAGDQDGTKQQQQGEHNLFHAFEVVTFGRPHHCALGVISSSAGGKNLHEDSSSKESNNPAVAAATFRPQRVQEFAQERVLREGSAVAVAAATHHTLVACRNGHLYVFGLNKGGRLGLGDDCPQQCPLPRRILSLKRKHVVAIAAAENHSLCVTSDGMVWAWGSNQFGQLGDSLGSNNSSSSGATSSSRSLPRPVEELRKMSCVAVAAGERHSVALSGRGEVYVWGNNTSGQLGVARRTGIQKVQRVEALWNSGSYSYQQQRKVAIAIAAADQSTLVLTAPVAGLAQANSVYWWGHGNHVPMRVQFNQAMSGLDDSSPSSMTKSQRLVNPVAIACAKYHNAAVTSDGCVYTWGTSSESLGRASGKTSPGTTRSSSGGHRATASPQLVSGMLPENGGGFAVSVSASEQHTAVVTDTGALFTWGVAHGKNVMGHEGVRWQPSPKRVPGVHRAVNVAVAKEHTVVLIGTTFPPIPPTQGLCSLEDFSSRAVARYVDLFNVVPILIMAEQTQVGTTWSIERESVHICCQLLTFAMLF
jgi:alpha-tubulin suppressor-like RCC1 family protein